MSQENTEHPSNTQDLYLTKGELKTVAPITVIDAITDTDEGVVNEIVEENIEIIKSFLSTYDVQTIFSQRGDARHKIVLKYLKDMVVHDIYTIHTRSQVNESLRDRYQDAMTWLEKISRGQLSPELPRLDRDEDGAPDTSFRGRSFAKYGTHH